MSPFLVFIAIATAALALDLFVQRGEAMTMRRALLWSALWVALSFGYAGYLHWAVSIESARLFVAGYVLEKALSADNLLVFLAIFKYFGLRGKESTPLQHRILYLGVLGAIGFRALFVGAGSILLKAGPWADLFFGILVAVSAYKLVTGGGEEEEDKGAAQANNWLVRQARKLFPVLPRSVGERFLVSRQEALAAGCTEEELAAADVPNVRPVSSSSVSTPDQGKGAAAARYMTPAFVCLLTIEASDVLFSADSVPTVIAVTRDPFIVYSAMIFAILGLRSLYFVLEHLSHFLVHLEKAILALLFFIAAKMFLHASKELLHWPHWDISPNQSLMVIVSVLGVGVVASLFSKDAEGE